jgi:hypothetical protein
MTLAWDLSDAAATMTAPRRVIPVARAGVLTQAMRRRGGRGDVAAVFDRSFYVRIGDEFLCIGEPAIGNGPLTLIAAARPASLGLHRGQAASVAEQHIVIGDLRFDLGHCETWRPPRWPVPAVRLSEIGAAIARRAATESPADSLAPAIFTTVDTPLARIARPRVARFETWLSEQIHDSSCPARAGHPVTSNSEISSRPPGLLDRPPARTMTAEGPVRHAAHLSLDPVTGLIGLGPGLTPSGDDFLMGALAVLDALGQTKSHTALAQAIADAAPALTSPLSACFLRAAAAGHVGESLYDAVALGLTGNLDAAVAAAQRTGHTSGWDMLAGVAATLRLLGSENYRTG